MTRIIVQGDVVIREEVIPADAKPLETSEIRIASETGNPHVIKGAEVSLFQRGESYWVMIVQATERNLEALIPKVPKEELLKRVKEITWEHADKRGQELLREGKKAETNEELWAIQYFLNILA